MKRGHLLLIALLLMAFPASAQQVRDFKDGAICYEIFVRSFFDSNGDGIGDLNGLTQKLDYVAGLGANCIWLMPVAESPSYHGYDVANYYKIEPDYGTNDDFKRFMTEAHRRGIRVLVDLVLNHASSEHPFFQEALRDTASPHRAWFRWSPTPGPKSPWGGEVWHRSPVRDEYYYGLFWSGMPDLNYENPAVLEESKRVSKFWLDSMGVDGFRLDAVRHLIEQGNEISNTPATHAVLRDFGGFVRQAAPRSYTIGEVWDSTGAVLKYYPDQLDAYFAFEVSDALIEAVRTGKAGRLLPAVERFQAAVPAYRFAPFQRNHDQTRTMTSLGGDVGRARLAATLLLTLPGIPFIYYGEEIGMTGDKPDERLRTPMHWTRAPRAGFTTAPTAWQALQPDSFTANVEIQQGDSGSLYNVYRRLIQLRAGNSALRSGELVPLTTNNEAVVAYLRKQSNRAVLVVANLGSAPVSRVALVSRDSTLTGGRYRVKSLLGGADGARLSVRWEDGRIRNYTPVPSLGAGEAYVFEITRTGR
jgi:alpha-amylase